MTARTLHSDQALIQNSEGTVAGRIQNLKPWKPGQSGNPGGRPKRDLAAEIARAIFERDAEAIERVFAAELLKGNSKVFGVLADRAYGKPHQSLDIGADSGTGNLHCIQVRLVRAESKEQSE
jgi:hypothetical protein